MPSILFNLFCRNADQGGPGLQVMGRSKVFYICLITNVFLLVIRLGGEFWNKHYVTETSIFDF
jgi:hypothetical protein